VASQKNGYPKNDVADAGGDQQRPPPNVVRQQTHQRQQQYEYRKAGRADPQCRPWRHPDDRAHIGGHVNERHVIGDGVVHGNAESEQGLSRIFVECFVERGRGDRILLFDLQIFGVSVSRQRR
jgi:hypothetical protein